MSEFLTSMAYKLGDAMWAMPTVKALAKKWGTKVDFVTSEYCSPILPLMESQSYIDRAFTDWRFDKIISGNPRLVWKFLLPFEGWMEEKHLRFEQFPDIHIMNYFSRQAGVEIEYPPFIEVPTGSPIKGDYLVVANSYGHGAGMQGRGEAILKEIVRQATIPVVQVGAAGEEVDGTVSCCGQDMLATAKVMSGAVAYIGWPSANATLASIIAVPQHIVVPSLIWQLLPIVGCVGDVVHYHLEAYDSVVDIASEILRATLP